MAVKPIQLNTDNTKSHTPYYNAKGAVKTDGMVRPLRPEGHLVDDSWSSKPKYFIKDIAYDMKALKDGFQGNANDHQSGHLNDVGLKLGGIGIATMLAAKTSNPMARIMEYVGLGTFLAAMDIFPKLAIYGPSEKIHGFDIGKEYIDEQGRKKSVFQDGNYIPFDMYQGDRPDEDLDIIGDKLGISRDVKNRHDVIKEQMRKIGIQNNTWWMITAGFATPVITALACCGLEKLIAPAVESVRNSRCNSNITKALALTKGMSDDVDAIKPNDLSKKIEKILVTYQGKEIPQNEIDSIINLITKDMDSFSSAAVKKDITSVLRNAHNGQTSYVIENTFADNIINHIQSVLPARKKDVFERVFVPSAPEVNEILNKLGAAENINDETLLNLKGEFKELFNRKIQQEPANIQTILKAQRNEVLEAISKKIKENPSNYVNENQIKELVDFAKVIGDFKQNQRMLDKYKSFKTEYAPETVLAKSYAKFEKTLLDVLGIKYKDLKVMRESEQYAQEIFDKKLSELVKDEAKYEKAVSKLAKVMQDMEIKLNGKSTNDAYLKDLINAIENNYNNTAIRLNKIGGFKETVDSLVKEDAASLIKNSADSAEAIKSRQDLFDFLDGVREDAFKGKDYWKDLTEEGRKEYVKYNSKGVGSSKNLEISRIVERYQGAKNSFNRILHIFDLYKRPMPEGGYDKEILEKGREALMNATSSEHTLKLNMVNNQKFYQDVMQTIWNPKLEASTDKALGSSELASGDVAGRFRKYITRFKDIMGNNDIDFTKSNHVLDTNAPKAYTKSSQTRLAKFNLVSQTPAEMIKNAAARRYGSEKWLRIASVIGGTVLGATVLAQFCFGKLRNPQNLQKQVDYDANK